MKRKKLFSRQNTLKLSSFIMAASLALNNAEMISAYEYDDSYNRRNTEEEIIAELSKKEQRGDINGDKTINVFDLMRYKNTLMEGNEKDFDTVEKSYRFDANSDDKLDGKDAFSVKKDILRSSKIWSYSSMPAMDGSTSAIPLEAQFKSKMLGINYTDAKTIVKHHKTHESFSMLLSGENDMIFTVPISEAQQKAADDAGVKLNFVPVAKEGFVFVVNKNNPVDSLTQQQIKDIYSGKITNWKELGGNDAPIIPYQRNEDSGSQNYMNEFMKDSSLMAAPKSYTLGSMAFLMDGLAVYDNAENAIGYSVYSYAAQMYENSSDVKFIAIDGIKPSRETMADNTYPLLSSTYILYTDKATQNTRDFADWAVSEEGQKCVLSGGYVPVIEMEYPREYMPYQEKGTGKEKPADYTPSKKYSSFVRGSRGEAGKEPYYIDFLRDKEYQKEINKVFEEIYKTYPDISCRIELINGYMSISFYKVSKEIMASAGYMNSEYSFAKTYTYDLINKKRIEKFSDLFYKDTDFISEVNDNIGFSINWLCPNLLKTDYLGLLGDVENFTLSSVFLESYGPYLSETGAMNYSSDYLYDSEVFREYYDNNQILDDRFYADDIYYSEWICEQKTGDDGEVHDVVTGSRFHTAEEVEQRNKIYEKVYNDAKARRTEYEIGRRVLISCFNQLGSTEDHLNLLYVNYGKLDGPFQNNNIYDPQTGERITYYDVFGDEYDNIKEIMGTDTGNIYAIDCETESLNYYYDPVHFDADKLNRKYLVPKQKDLKMYELSSPLKGIAKGGEYHDLFGYETSYVIDFGLEIKHWEIEGEWNIIAKSKCYSHGTTWYECWDADDGDYYGWITGNSISFE